MKSGHDTTDITYHPTFGRPLVVTRNGHTIKYDYDETTGLIKSRKEGNRLVKFQYHRTCQKVSKVTEGKNWTNFNYDGKCNLVSAKNSRGQTVALHYDHEGRIVAMTDQARREVKITYEDRFGKPKLLERPGVGSLEVTYKSNGELSKVNSPDGPGVATQVAGAFNNLLEIVEPAGIELGL
jgi:YD repeat-containing protein